MVSFIQHLQSIKTSLNFEDYAQHKQKDKSFVVILPQKEAV